MPPSDLEDIHQDWSEKFDEDLEESKPLKKKKRKKSSKEKKTLKIKKPKKESENGENDPDADESLEKYPARFDGKKKLILMVLLTWNIENVVKIYFFT